MLIESVNAEEQVFEIARSTKRLSALIFGAFDYWGSLRMVGEPYRTDHPLVDHARARIVKAAASVGIPAIAEMTLNYPTKEKSEAEKKAALDECRRDAELREELRVPRQVDGDPGADADRDRRVLVLRPTWSAW